ncbi:MAG: hypothetical protein ACOCY1_00380 [Halovenus sp.]
MRYDDTIKARAEPEEVDEIEAIAERTDLHESEVVRRLVNLGLQDIREIGDEVLLNVGDPQTEVEVGSD